MRMRGTCRFWYLSSVDKFREEPLARLGVALAQPSNSRPDSGAHGTPAQRFHNLLCLAYGADPQLFGDIVEKGHLPKERAEGCKEEYQQVSYAFQQLIGPHLDPVLAKEVMDKTWLPDAKWRMQRSPGSE
jgi:hypothetical protein